MRLSRRQVMQRMAAAAILVGLAIFGAKAQGYTHVQVHSQAVGVDTYKIYIYSTSDASGNAIGSKVFTNGQINGYWDGTCSCYHVPLTVISWVSGYSASNAASSKVQHLSPNLPTGQESMIEILD